MQLSAASTEPNPHTTFRARASRWLPAGRPDAWVPGQSSWPWRGCWPLHRPDSRGLRTPLAPVRRSVPPALRLFEAGGADAVELAAAARPVR